MKNHYRRPKQHVILLVAEPVGPANGGFGEPTYKTKDFGTHNAVGCVPPRCGGNRPAADEHLSVAVDVPARN